MKQPEELAREISNRFGLDYREVLTVLQTISGENESIITSQPAAQVVFYDRTSMDLVGIPVD